MSPSAPVAQKTHPSAQPTCEERQRVWWVSKSGMRTDSTRVPSGELEQVAAEAVGCVDGRHPRETRLRERGLGAGP